MLKNIPTATDFVDEWTHEWICHTDRSGQIDESNWYSDANTVHYQMFDTVPQYVCLLYTSPSPRDLSTSRMPSSA